MSLVLVLAVLLLHVYATALVALVLVFGSFARWVSLILILAVSWWCVDKAGVTGRCFSSFVTVC